MNESRKLTFYETLFCGGISGAIAKTLIGILIYLLSLSTFSTTR